MNIFLGRFGSPWRSRSAVARRGPASRGFGAVELIVNIFLIGVVIVMILKGQAGVDYAGGFFTALRIEQVQLLVYQYREDHSFLPGDDPLAPRRFRRERALTRDQFDRFADLTDSGVINGRFLDPDNPEGEHYMAWRDLRSARLIDGDPAVTGVDAMPSNLFGGVYGFDGGNLGMSSGSLCLTRVPGRSAEIIDSQLDDGVIDTGNVRATARSGTEAEASGYHFDEADSGPYNPDTRYMLCTTQLPL